METGYLEKHLQRFSDGGESGLNPKPANAHNISLSEGSTEGRNKLN